MKMDPLTTNRARTFQSQIPVPVRKPQKSSNLISKESEFSQRQTLSQNSKSNKLSKNSHCLQKQLVKNSKPQENKTGNYDTCKANKKCSSVSQTSNSDKTTTKNSNIKELGNKTNSQVNDVPSIKSYAKSKISKNTPFVSQTSNIDKTAAVNFHPVKKEHIKSWHPPEKFVKGKNIINSKNKLTSSKGTVQTAKKVSSNSKTITKGTSEVISEKENQETDETSCFSAQKGIKFEANEFFRNMILNGKELSPSMCKLSGIASSSVQTQRPSIYQKFELHPNPYQDALQAIANLSARRASKNISIQNDKKIARQPLFQERNSFYTPCADPREEVMRSLEALKARRLQKSALKNSKKKVTFNLHIEEYTAKVHTDSEPISSKNTEVKLTQINERSEENTPSSPVKNNTEIVNLENNQYQEPCVQIKAAVVADNTGGHIHSSTREGFETCTSPAKSTTTTKDVQTKTCVSVEPPLCKVEEINLRTSPLRSDYGRITFTEEAVNNQKASDILFERNTNGQRVKKSSQPKLYTPRPISFYSNSKLLNDIPSPELLTGKTFLSSLAPIYTPLALKSIAKNSAGSPDADLSPVRLKLDFTATENDTPLKENFARRLTLSNLQKIVTVQKKLDDLADQECRFWLPEGIPIVCGRHLQNPVAVTLTEGDEMHFLPIRL